MSTFTARYRSRCSSCEGWVREGDTVRYDGPHLVHDTCPGGVDETPGAVCRTCNLTLSKTGACGC